MHRCPDNRIELLAPAGTKEALVAAVRAGADAIYLGVGKYHARLATDAFNIRDLQVLMGYARQHGVNTYFALNTLIKQSELKDLEEVVAQLAALKPDGIIVQDLGVARILHTRHPEIPLHASTQLTCHNLAGLKTLASLGFCRVVMARELSLEELAWIAPRSPVELEVFCHGALCVGMSGLCLFSSIIGGHSGNRGRCTQPCRRIWRSGGKQGYLFSPKDLQAAEHLSQLRALGIAALKIEGRLRSSEYVHTVVRAYRLLLDALENDYETALAEAGCLLSRDWARDKTNFCLSGLDPNLFTPHQAQCLGKRMGKVLEHRDGALTISVFNPLKSGDRIRIADQQRDITRSLTLQRFEAEGDCYTFPLVEVFYPGNPVFKAGDASWDERAITQKINRIFQEARPPPIFVTAKESTPPVAESWPWVTEHFRGGQSENLWITIDSPEWIPLLEHLGEAFMLVCFLSPQNLQAFKDAFTPLANSNMQVACEIPPFLTEQHILEYQTVLQTLAQAGVQRWVINNIGHFQLFPREGAKNSARQANPEGQISGRCSVDILRRPPQGSRGQPSEITSSGQRTEFIAGPFLYAWNVQAAALLWEQRIRYFVASWEDDFPNIRALAHALPTRRIIATLFGYPPVIRSKMFTAQTILTDPISGPTDLRFHLTWESDHAVLWPEKPVCYFGLREKLRQVGVHNFGINLTHLSPSKKALTEIYSAFLGQYNLPDSMKFNVKRGVR